jgi:hypothetical protein
VNTIANLAGTFEGTGTWHDAAGKTQGYRVRHRALPTDTGFEVIFTHDFDDGSVVNGHFAMTWVAPFLFRVDVAGSPIGNGYVFGGHCHYHLQTGDAFVEASYHADVERMAVFGSSSKNAEGLYIAWTEQLVRTSADPA